MQLFNRKVQRITRLYYWIAWFLCTAIFSVIYFIFAMEYQHHEPVIMNIVFLLTFLVQSGYLIPLTIKRFHDAGYSTGYFWLCFIMILVFGIGNLMIFYVTMQKSDTKNQWGENPSKKEYDQEADFYRR